MPTKLVIALYLFCGFALHTQAQDNSTSDLNHRLEQLWSNSMVPGMAIASIENGKVQYGLKGVNHLGIPISSTSMFDVASLTKSITTLVTLKLVESNLWDLDTPLSTYWIDPDVAQDRRHEKLTSRHVLSHQTGFKNWRYLNKDKKLAFDFDPGTKFQYSGEGYEYLRRALENKFRTSLEELALTHVFEPNGMKNSHFVWNKDVSEQKFAGTHDKEGKPYTYKKTLQANAADNLLTTITDFTALGVHLLDQDILGPETYDMMIRPVAKVRKGIDFGLGWIVFNDLVNDEFALFNAGSDTGVNALIVLLPKSKRGLIIMTNGDNGRELAMKSIALVLGETGKELLNRFQ